MAHTVQQLERMSAEELDGLLAMKLFSGRELGVMRRNGWDTSFVLSNVGYPRWNLWNDVHPEQWACTPDRRIREYPLLSSSYEGMARVIAKIVEKGFSLSISRESEVMFTDMDGNETRYAGDGHGGKCLPWYIAITSILALEKADSKSLAKWSLRGWLKGQAG
jgi:hypothetical protein